MDRLWLRIHARLLRLTYTEAIKTIVYEDDLEEEDSGSDLAFGFDPAGGVTVRLTF